MAAYYNENDLFTAAWLRELIKAGLIADGEVDTRSIVDVQPEDVRGFVQCHFFAGIGGWSYALRLAGWPDERAVWTGSCPCQPWSMAGGGKGADDPRHLWPAWFGLIAECRPAALFGEQVASRDGLYWLDLVYADLEAAGYAVGAVDLCAAGAGAPHARSRLWFVADTNGQRVQNDGLLQADGAAAGLSGEARKQRIRADVESGGRLVCDCEHGPDDHWGGTEDCMRCSCTYFVGALEHTDSGRTERIAGDQGREKRSSHRGGQTERRRRLQALNASTAGGVGHTNGEGLALRSVNEDRSGAIRLKGPTVGQAGATRGFWADCEWLYHRDGVYRAVEPGAFPLVARLPGDVEQIRAFGNAIVPQVAAVFIQAYQESVSDA